MDCRIVKEYADTRIELVKVQECITEYMKMFFAVGALIIAIGAFVVEFMNKHDSSPLGLTPIAGGYILGGLTYVTLMFATILFHKFNSHNRYSGYARALSREVWTGPPDASAEHHLWEAVLGRAYPGQSPATGPVTIDLEERTKDAKSRDAGCLIKWGEPSFWLNVGLYFPRGTLGLWMVMRATVLRYPTRSWTYPYQVAFGPFFLMAVLTFIWIKSCLLPNAGDAHLVFQWAMVTFWFLSMLGLGYRMYRLCHEQGDRTVVHYCDVAMINRHQLLKNRGLDVSYVN